MWKLFKTKKPVVFKDDDQFADIYNTISKAEINFDTDDNKNFSANINNKLWISVWYSTWSDEITMNSFVRVITDPNAEGKRVGTVSVETNFNEENKKRLNKLLDVKIDEWRIHNLDRVEAERKEKMKTALKD